MSTTADTSDAYRLEEREWFDRDAWADADAYRDSDEHAARADVGEGDEWGHAHSPTTGTDKHAWLAFKILKQTGRVLCATTLFAPPDRPDVAPWTPALSLIFDDEPLDIEHDPDAIHERNREVELTDSEVVVPKSAPEQWGGVAYAGYSGRTNPETGYLSGGESTGCVIADRPLPEFMHVVETVLALAQLPPQRHEETRAYAEQLKREGELRDRDILARVLALADN